MWRLNIPLALSEAEWNEVKCALCGSINYIPLLQAKDYRLRTTEQVFDIVRCLQCGIVYLNLRPNDDDLAKFYPETFYAGPTVISKLVSNFLESFKI